MYSVEAVGVVRNKCKNVKKAAGAKKLVSTIEVDEKYSDGLFMTEICGYLDILFYFHDLKKEKIANEFTKTIQGEKSWRVKTRAGEERGVFASRSPKRPNAIGVTAVRLIGRDGNKLRVTGLDAVDGTPVLDIKACDTSQFEEPETNTGEQKESYKNLYEGPHEKLHKVEQKGSHTGEQKERYFQGKEIHDSVMKSNPRITIWKHIMAGNTETLLMEAGKMHGHYCPGLAMGVMAATRAMQEIRIDSDGLEDLLAIVETNNCLSDGVQWVTGCSFGNNSLIFYDLGKMAFTLTKRDGNGIRFISRHESQDYIRASFPDFDEWYHRVVVQQSRDPEEIAAYRKKGIERAFGTLKLDVDRLFDIRQVKANIPDYAPSHESIRCAHCGESVMATRIEVSGDQKLCLTCSGSSVAVLNGNGMGSVG